MLNFPWVGCGTRMSLLNAMLAWLPRPVRKPKYPPLSISQLGI